MSRAKSGRIVSRRSAIITTLGLAMAPRLVRAQDAATFPDHPVRIIVSTAAGGGVDAFARIVTQKMSVDLGQPFPVENRAGAGGSVGADAVFHSTPDGYTLLASQPAPITTNALLLKGLDYDPAQLEAVSAQDPSGLRHPFPQRGQGAAQVQSIRLGASAPGGVAPGHVSWRRDRA